MPMTTAEAPNGVRAARKAKNLSLNKLAWRVGITAQAIHAIETMPNRRPRDRTAAALAAALDTTVAELFPETAA